MASHFIASSYVFSGCFRFRVYTFAFSSFSWLWHLTVSFALAFLSSIWVLRVLIRLARMSTRPLIFYLCTSRNRSSSASLKSLLKNWPVSDLSTILRNTLSYDLELSGTSKCLQKSKNSAKSSALLYYFISSKVARFRGERPVFLQKCVKMSWRAFSRW